MVNENKRELINFIMNNYCLCYSIEDSCIHINLFDKKDSNKNDSNNLLVEKFSKEYIENLSKEIDFEPLKNKYLYSPLDDKTCEAFAYEVNKMIKNYENQKNINLKGDMIRFVIEMEE